MYTLVISSYWYIMHIVLLLLGVKASIFIIMHYIIFISLSFDKFRIEYLHEIGRFAFDVQH